MDKVTTTEALKILRGRGLTVSYPTMARWVQSGLFKGAERVTETRGPVWLIPRASVFSFEPPKTGRPASTPAARKRATGQASASNGTSGKARKGGKR